MKYLIDPNFVDAFPWTVLPWVIGIKFGLGHHARLRTIGLGKHVTRAFGKDGYDGAEMNISNAGIFDHTCTIREDKLAAYKKLGRNIYAFHACYSYPPPGLSEIALNPCTNDERTHKLLMDNIRIASELGTQKNQQVLVLHAGHVADMKSIPKGMEDCIQLLSSVADYAREKKVIIALENLYHHGGDAVIGADNHIELLEIADEVGSKQIGFTFDWGHANVAARDVGLSDSDLRTFEHQKRIIDDMGKRIVHGHIHYNHNHLEDLRSKSPDNYVQRDEHLPLTRIRPDEMDDWKESIRHLKKKSSLDSEHASVTLELPQKRALGFLPVLQNGAVFTEQMESLRILKDAFQ